MTNFIRVKTSLATAIVLFGAIPAAASVQINNFTGYYAVSNWTAVEEGDSSVDTSGAPLSVMLTSSNAATGSNIDVSFSIAAAASGLFEFDWDYFTRDVDGPNFDPAFYINDVVIQLTNDGGVDSQSGSISVPVLAGDTIGWLVRATDDIFGSADLTISNFSAPVPDGSGIVPEAASLLIWSGLGLIGSVATFRRHRR